MMATARNLASSDPMRLAGRDLLAYVRYPTVAVGAIGLLVTGVAKVRPPMSIGCLCSRRVVVELIVLRAQSRCVIGSSSPAPMHGRAARHHEVTPADLIAARHGTPARHLGDRQAREAVTGVHIVAARDRLG